MQKKRRSRRPRVRAYAPRRRKRNSIFLQAKPKHRRRYYAHRNPGGGRRRRRSYAPRRRSYRNPSRAGKVTSVFTMAGSAIGGGLAARALTQLLLGSKNTGPLGYLANGFAAFLLGKVASMTLGPKIGTWVTVGGAVGIVMRAAQEYTPFGQAIQGAFSGLGDHAFAGMSGFEPTDFFSPLASADARGQVTGAVVIPDAVGRVARAQLPITAPAMAGLGGRSRYTGSRVWGGGM
jgi:hypothetical protein